jgi:glycosyltransferase involved in cell wall biosynthesis
MKSELTVIIPCKNEEAYIYRTLESISKQINYKGVRIIVADNFSTDNTKLEISRACSDFGLNLEIVEGGPVSVARNNGATHATTPYIVFIDADAVLLDTRIFSFSMFLAKELKYKLVTCKTKSLSNSLRSKLIFSLFNFIQAHLLKSPFSTGVYFFTEKDEFNRLGRFDESVTQSEDYLLSKKYNRKDFTILKQYAGQDDRRFKKMGYTGFLKLIVKNYLNRKDVGYFRKDTNYWA